MKILVAKYSCKRPKIDWNCDTNAKPITDATPRGSNNATASNDKVCNTNLEEAPQTVHNIDLNPLNYETFPCSKTLLESASSYFVALNNFKEGKDNMVVLKDISTKEFSIFVDWINTGESDWRNPSYKDMDALVDAYALGRRLMVPAFQDFVIDQIRAFDGGHGQINIQRLRELYELGFTSTDQIVKYFMDRIAYRAAVTDTWSLDLPDTTYSDGEDSACQPTDIFLLPLMQKVVEMFRSARAWGAGNRYIDASLELMDPKSDKRKTYHIVQGGKPDAVNSISPPLLEDTTQGSEET